MKKYKIFGFPSKDSYGSAYTYPVAINHDCYGTKLHYDLADTQLSNIKSNELLPDKIVYGQNGTITSDGGIIQPNNTFTDISAKLYSQIQLVYNNLEPRVLTDDDRTIDRNVYIIPTKSDGTALLDTSNVTDMSDLFSNCDNLISIPPLDTSKATSMNYTFISCTNLQTVPLLDTSKVTYMYNMFADCTNLQTVPLLDTSKVTDMSRMFDSCHSLSDESLNNILSMCANAVSYTGTKTLERMGLSQEQATRCTTLSNYSAFTAAGWTTGY